VLGVWSESCSLILIKGLDGKRQGWKILQKQICSQGEREKWRERRERDNRFLNPVPDWSSSLWCWEFCNYGWTESLTQFCSLISLSLFLVFFHSICLSLTSSLTRFFPLTHAIVLPLAKLLKKCMHVETAV